MDNEFMEIDGDPNSDRQLALLYRTFTKHIEKYRSICLEYGMDEFAVPSLEIYPDCSGGIIFLHGPTNQIRDLDISDFTNFYTGVEKLLELAQQ